MPGMRVVEAAQHRRDQRRCTGSGVAPSRTRPRRSPTSSCTSCRAVVGVGEDPPGQRQQRLAGAVSAMLPRARSNSGAPRSSSRAVNLLTESDGWVTPTTLGGLGEVPGLGHRHEVPELLELHHPIAYGYRHCGHDALDD